MGLEAAHVATVRTIKIASGGKGAQAEFDLMIREKVDAASQLQARLLAMGASATPAASAALTLRHYKRKVSANRRRLSR